MSSKMSPGPSWNLLRSSVFLFFLHPAFGEQLPAGTDFQLRLTDPVGSATSKVKDPVHAVLIVPLVSKDRTLVPAGAEFSGEVREVLASSSATSDSKQANLLLSFNAFISQACLL